MPTAKHWLTAVLVAILTEVALAEIGLSAPAPSAPAPPAPAPSAPAPPAPAPPAPPSSAPPPRVSEPSDGASGSELRDRLDLGDAWRLRQRVAAPSEPLPRDASRKRRAEELLRRAGVAPSEQVPPEARLDLSAAPNLLPRDAVAARQAWQIAWLTGDADAGFALLGPATRSAIERTLADWQRRAAEPAGWAALLAHLRSTGRARHADALAELGRLDEYGHRRFFLTEWDHQHRQVDTAWEMLNSWAAYQGKDLVFFVAGRFTLAPHRIGVRFSRDEQTGVFSVEPLGPLEP